MPPDKYPWYYNEDAADFGHGAVSNDFHFLFLDQPEFSAGAFVNGGTVEFTTQLIGVLNSDGGAKQDLRLPDELRLHVGEDPIHVERDPKRHASV